MAIYQAEKMIEEFIYLWGCCTPKHIKELVHPYPESKIKRLIKGMLVEQEGEILKPIYAQLSPIEAQRTLKFLDFLVEHLQDKVTSYYPAKYPYVAQVRTTKGKDAMVCYVLPGEATILRDVINTAPAENIIFILEDPNTKEILQQVRSKAKTFLDLNGNKL
ncbi:DUF5697 family protein [Anaerocellum danielii]|uniref:DUF5697 family protein n=1 Tax=Anaerocellum danielii TaxID=1387557 RepID=A0ABZ0TYH9_9FIRM|nr:DUF5697 family protein [Caldicellulosiruptor danielii]WPX08116.1 DUF5697 family protein [Caldicellulosiruptor danielii]